MRAHTLNLFTLRRQPLFELRLHSHELLCHLGNLSFVDALRFRTSRLRRHLGEVAQVRLEQLQVLVYPTDVVGGALQHRNEEWLPFIDGGLEFGDKFSDRILVEGTASEMLFDSAAEFFELPCETVAELVHLLLFVVDVDKGLLALGLQLRVQLVGFKPIDPFAVEAHYFSGHIGQVFKLNFDVIRGCCEQVLPRLTICFQSGVHAEDAIEVLHLKQALGGEPLEAAVASFHLRQIREEYLLDSLQKHQLETLTAHPGLARLMAGELADFFKIEILLQSFRR